MKRVVRFILSPTCIIALLAVVQILLFIFLTFYLASTGVVAYTLLTILSVLVMLWVMDKDDLNPAYKVMWLLLMVLLPPTGALCYLVWGHRVVPRRIRRQLQATDERIDAALVQDEAVMQSLLATAPRQVAQSVHYLRHHATAPVYAAEGVEYYPLGKDFYPRFLEAIRGAKKFIFMQYHIFQDGVMLDTTVEILRQKAAEGVDVRLIWDGLGSMFTLPPDMPKKLRSYGIKCYPFSPVRFTLHLSEYAMLNRRDHRKITVVDGTVAFSGGLNFSDEYINVKERFGLWKDTSFMLRGQAVFALTATFLRAWDYVARTTSCPEDYRLPPQVPPPQPSMAAGYVQPYCDTPLDSENVSENAYLNLIRQAQDYVYISTPYLIPDHEMVVALTLAAKSGVDVRIMTPGIPDKRFVFAVTQSYYPVLLRGGVRIYEYTPGFNHAKMYVTDDAAAIIGSANMDYRSLYLHFENCAAFYGGQIVQDVKADMLACFEQCHEVTLAETRKTPPLRRLAQIFGRFFSPLL